jgi:NDP-sugar pyrophosphorylase family protein
MKLLLSKVPNPELYGNAIIEGQKVKGLIEKPESPSSDIIVNSAYRFNHEFIKKLASDSGDEQYKLERVLSEYLHTHPSDFEMIPKEEIPSLKYPWDALSIMERLLEEVKTKVKGTVSDKARINGDVFIDEGAIVMDGAMIEGPAYIGRGAVVGTSALVRQSSLEAGSVVGFGSEVARSLIGPGAKLHHGFVGDCILGPRVWLGFGFISANRRFDKQPVKAEVKGQKASTNRGHFGCVIGEGTRFGIRGSTMPGMLIGKNVTVGPNTSITTNVPDGKTIYSKQEIVMK